MTLFLLQRLTNTSRVFEQAITLCVVAFKVTNNAELKVVEQAVFAIRRQRGLYLCCCLGVVAFFNRCQCLLDTASIRCAASQLDQYQG